MVLSMLLRVYSQLGAGGVREAVQLLRDRDHRPSTLNPKPHNRRMVFDGSSGNVVPVSVYDRHSVGLSIRPISTRCRFITTDTIQVGCAKQCNFCATGTMGLRADLSAGEIAEQVHLARPSRPSRIPEVTQGYFGY